MVSASKSSQIGVGRCMRVRPLQTKIVLWGGMGALLVVIVFLTVMLIRNDGSVNIVPTNEEKPKLIAEVATKGTSKSLARELTEKNDPKKTDCAWIPPAYQP